MRRSLIMNALSRIDPSRTSGLRKSFEVAMNRRFIALKADIQTSIVDQDCFGIKRIRGLAATMPEQFAFKIDPEKIQSFMDWLRQQEELGILEVVIRSGTGGIQSAWSDVYIKTAYTQGIRRAIAEMQRAGIDLSANGLITSGQLNVITAFNQPIHADAVGVLYMRTFEDLKSVTSVMNAAIQRTISDGLRSGIAQGIAEGKGAAQIARDLMKDTVNQVDKIGVTRARMIARTEVIRAHHLANVAEYRRVDQDMQIEVEVEFSSASDACPICSDLDGKIFTLDQIESMIPVHVNCRCSAIPHVTRNQEAA